MGIFPLWLVLLDYLLGAIVWTLIGRSAAVGANRHAASLRHGRIVGSATNEKSWPTAQQATLAYSG